MIDMMSQFIKMDNYLSKLNISVTVAEPGFVEFSMPFDSSLLRPGGFMNGGAMMTAMDAAGGLSVMTYGDVINEVTVSMTTNFLHSVKNGPVRITAKVTKRGKTITFSKIKLYDGDAKLCAEATGSWFITRGSD